MASIINPSKPGIAQVSLPRITIKFCVQCKWNLRAAYFAQELLQTFSTSIGEISLVPVTGGIFTVTILHTSSDTPSEAVETLLWDRKAEGGFPETKELKNRVRNLIDPGKDMGHIDRRLKKDREEADRAKNDESRDAVEPTTTDATTGAKAHESTSSEKFGEECMDCK